MITKDFCPPEPAIGYGIWDRCPEQLKHVEQSNSFLITYKYTCVYFQFILSLVTGQCLWVESVTRADPAAQGQGDVSKSIISFDHPRCVGDVQLNDQLFV